MCSKDNDYFHKNLREFFDKPIAYSTLGSRTNILSNTKSMNILKIVPEFLKSPKTMTHYKSRTQANLLGLKFKEKYQSPIKQKLPLLKKFDTDRKRLEIGIIRTNHEIIEVE